MNKNKLCNTIVTKFVKAFDEYYNPYEYDTWEDDIDRGQAKKLKGLSKYAPKKIEAALKLAQEAKKAWEAEHKIHVKQAKLIHDIEEKIHPYMRKKELTMWPDSDAEAKKLLDSEGMKIYKARDKWYRENDSIMKPYKDASLKAAQKWTKAYWDCMSIVKRKGTAQDASNLGDLAQKKAELAKKQSMLCDKADKAQKKYNRLMTDTIKKYGIAGEGREPASKAFQREPKLVALWDEFKAYIRKTNEVRRELEKVDSEIYDKVIHAQDEYTSYSNPSISFKDGDYNAIKRASGSLVKIADDTSKKVKALKQAISKYIGVVGVDTIKKNELKQIRDAITQLDVAISNVELVCGGAMDVERFFRDDFDHFD